MLDFLRGKASDRKFRLFAVSCVRAVWDGLADERSRRAVEVAELYADGRITNKLLRATRIEAKAVWTMTPWDWLGPWGKAHAAWDALRENAKAGAVGVIEVLARGPDHVSVGVAAAFASSARDIIGNPFHPVLPEPHWLTPTAVALADAIYASRGFDRLPVLADALEEAGCNHPDMLAHCRDAGPHYRGCWAVDLVLGKK